MRAILKEYNVKSAEDINHVLKGLFGGLLRRHWRLRLTRSLAMKREGTGNRRNGHTEKSVRMEHGELELAVPRDRTGEFHPLIVKKHQKEITGIDEQIPTLYTKGVSVREIQAYLNQLCGIDVSPTLISNVTNRIMPLIKEWQSTPLQKTYAESYNPGGETGKRLLRFSSIRRRFAS